MLPEGEKRQRSSWSVGANITISCNKISKLVKVNREESNLTADVKAKYMIGLYWDRRILLAEEMPKEYKLCL